MLQALINVFRIPELRNKILFTLGMLAVYRIGFWIPLPGVNQIELAKAFENASEGTALAKIGQFITMFSGGNFSHSTIFGLGIMPYISASIIFQLLGTAVPRLKKMQEEGPTGRQKILEWQRYATIGLCLVQGTGWLQYMATQPNMVYSEWLSNPMWWVMCVAALTAGTYYLTARVTAVKPAAFIAAYFGGVELRFLGSLLVLGVYLYRSGGVREPGTLPLLIAFFALYFLYAGFEIWAILSNLRPFSKSG